MKPKTKNHYFNVEDFKHWITDTDKYAEQIGKALMDLVNGLASLPDWKGYSWIEDMKSEAVITLWNVVKRGKVDPSKGSPFSYLNLIARNKFIEILKREKKVLEKHDKYREELYGHLSSQFSEQELKELEELG